MRPVCLALAALILAGLPASPRQPVVILRSGDITAFEGDVVADGQRLVRTSHDRLRLAPGTVLLTRSGRVESLLTSDVYLRLGENSAARMIRADVAGVRLELLAGSAIIDALTDHTGATTQILANGAEIEILTAGASRIDTGAGQFRVYRGKASVAENRGKVDVGTGQLYALPGSSVARRLSNGPDNLLELWSEERHHLLASGMVTPEARTGPLLSPDSPVRGGLYASLGLLPAPTALFSGEAPVGMNVEPAGSLYGLYLIAIEGFNSQPGASAAYPSPNPAYPTYAPIPLLNGGAPYLPPPQPGRVPGRIPGTGPGRR